MAKKSAKPTNDEQIGFHKGAIATLAKERAELIRLITIVEQLIQAHIKELKDLGVDIVKEAEKSAKKSKKKEPIEDLLRKA